MKLAKVAFSIACGLCLFLLIGCDHKPTPLKEGVVTKVIWTTGEGSQTGLYREKMSATPRPGQGGGSYNVDMYGLLYPSHLEVRFVGTQDSHSQIIPFRQIIWLEFGDGGIKVSKP